MNVDADPRAGVKGVEGKEGAIVERQGLPWLADEPAGGGITVAPHPDDGAVEVLPPERVRSPVRGRRVARRRERRRRWRFVGIVVVVIAAFVSVAVFVLPHKTHQATIPPPRAFGPAPPSIAWALSWGTPDLGSSLAVVGVPTGDPAIAVVAPDDARVDLPGGAPLTVAPAAANGASAIETAQALLNRRVGHYLLSTPHDIGLLVGRMGKLTFSAQASIIVDSVAIGPGQTTANGPQVEAYLTSGIGVDQWVRWEDVLSGILDAKPPASAWSQAPGRTDDAAVVTALLGEAHGATVVDMPTAHLLGLLKVDTDGMTAMIESSFKASVGGLVRVIVQNGNGLPGMGAQVGELLAPYGFRVIQSQNAGSFDEPQTKILASSSAYMRWAEEARGLMRAGKVYEDPQPTGIADLTIIVGIDFGSG